MMAPPERSPDRDAAIEAMTPLVPKYGWTTACVRRAMPAEEPAWLFPGGTIDMIECFCDLADRHMEKADPVDGGLTARIRSLIAARLRQQRNHKHAVRRAVAALAWPANAASAMRCTARTVDTIWHAAGDQTADFNWYTKRGTLAAVYVPTMLYWLHDESEEEAATLAFLDRALAGIARIGRRRRPELTPPTKRSVDLTGA